MPATVVTPTEAHNRVETCNIYNYNSGNINSIEACNTYNSGIKSKKLENKKIMADYI